MKYKPFIAVGIVAIIAVVAIAALGQRDEQSAQNAASLPAIIKTAQVEADHTKSTPQAIPKGQYITYAPGVAEATPGTKLLFFHAPWCRQCNEIEASMKAQGIPDGVSVIKVDYDSSFDLRRKYNVTQQTTFVKVDDSGALIEKFVAYQEPTFDSVRRELL